MNLDFVSEWMTTMSGWFTDVSSAQMVPGLAYIIFILLVIFTAIHIFGQLWQPKYCKEQLESSDIADLDNILKLWGPDVISVNRVIKTLELVREHPVLDSTFASAADSLTEPDYSSSESFTTAMECQTEEAFESVQKYDTLSRKMNLLTTQKSRTAK